MRDFNAWLSTFRASIADYGYYVDFPKIYKNVEKIKVELNILNSLIGSKNIEEEFIQLVGKYPETLKCIPLLLAVRTNEIYAIDGDGEFTYSFKEANQTIEQYCVFMRKTGLFDLTPAMCRLDYTMSEAGGATNFVRRYTIASGGSYCDCGYKKKI